MSLCSFTLRIVIAATLRIVIAAQTVSFGLGFASAQRPARVEVASPESVGMRGDVLERIDGLVEQALAAKKMPGCVVAVGRAGRLVFLRAHGHRQLKPSPEKMTVDTVFDLASLTKPLATATSIMILREQGRLELYDPVCKYIPDFGTRGKSEITIQHLLTHQGGLIADNPLRDYDQGAEIALKRIYNLDLRVPPGAKFIYSDVGYIVLADLVERLSGIGLDEFSQEHIFQPLEMLETGFVPGQQLQSRCAPTERRNGHWIKGVVHDPRAFKLGGIAGHAGLFSTANDLAVFAQMMISGGTWGKTQILKSSSVAEMTKPYDVSPGIRGLGWDKRTGYSTNRAKAMSDRAYGHGGFTGAVLWIDPQHELFYIFLSNRLHPDGTGSINRLAGSIGDVVMSAIQQPLANERPSTAQEVGSGQPRNAPHQDAGVWTGLDQLVAEDFQSLAGKRVGLITNQTGIDRHGRHNVDLMHGSPNVNLVALFSPEHGLTGNLDKAYADTLDSNTRLTVYSLYGENRQPTGRQLEQIDCLVFDVQDIGTRFYTYISTMGLAMEAAAEHGVEFVVLDRPNPIGGDRVDGPMLDGDQRSFVGYHDLPVQHGMTIGELAQLFAREKRLHLNLRVVQMSSWKRSQPFDQTGLLWVNPSPNIRNLNQALLYPGVGLLEMTNVSVGRGTDTPFELVGGPWVDGQELAAMLNQRRLPGVSFVPRRFVPQASVFAGQPCGGVHILITDRGQIRALQVGTTMAVVLRYLYPKKWSVEGYLKLLGNREVFDAVKSAGTGRPLPDIESLYEPALRRFRERREPHLLYR